MLTPFQFGYKIASLTTKRANGPTSWMRAGLAAGGAAPAAPAPAPAPAPVQGVRPAGTGWGEFARNTAQGYGHQLNKFYNPYSKAWNEPAKDNIERGLQYAGRTAMAVGAGAAATAGGIAAAPAIASAANAGTAAIGSGIAAVGTQAPQIAQRASNMANQAAHTYNTVGGTLDKWKYPPQDIAADVSRVATGHPGEVQGPGGIVPKTRAVIGAAKAIPSAITSMMPAPTPKSPPMAGEPPNAAGKA